MKLKIFGTVEFFESWLSKPSYGLDNQLPIEMIKSSDGIKKVEEELLRITYGDLS